MKPDNQLIQLIVEAVERKEIRIRTYQYQQQVLRFNNFNTRELKKPERV